jgi:hypothetical protein
MSKTDYLTEDAFLPSGQKYICMSFLTDKPTESAEEGVANVKKTTLSGIKIRGAFETYEAACEHAKTVQSIDPYFNVFVGEMGKWLPFDPNPDSEAVKDSQYANEELNNMMKTYMENQEKAKIYHEQRKQEMVRTTIIDNLQSRKESLANLEKNLDKAQSENDKNEVLSIEQSMKAIAEQIKTMEERKEELDEQITNLSDQIKSFNPLVKKNE